MSIVVSIKDRNAQFNVEFEFLTNLAIMLVNPTWVLRIFGWRTFLYHLLRLTQLRVRKPSRISVFRRKNIWTHWELNPTPLAIWVLSERDNQLHHVPLYMSSPLGFLESFHIVPAGTGVTGIFELRRLEFNSTRARRLEIGRSKTFRIRCHIRHHLLSFPYEEFDTFLVITSYLCLLFRYYLRRLPTEFTKEVAATHRLATTSPWKWQCVGSFSYMLQPYVTAAWGVTPNLHPSPRVKWSC